jgi:hypothetical protein
MQSVDDLVALASSPDVGAIVLDAHTIGVETISDGATLGALSSLRAIRPELPLVLLSDSTDDEPGEAEDVFDMVVDRVKVSAHWPVYEARLLRSMGRYEDAMNDKLRRIRDLVDHQIDGTLTADGERELASLRSDVERPANAQMARLAGARRARLDAEDERLARLETIVTRLHREVANLSQA